MVNCGGTLITFMALLFWHIMNQSGGGMAVLVIYSMSEFVLL